MSSELLTVCPSCGKSSLKRLMAGGAGMIFKGSGFYLTDYKKTGSSTGSNSPTATTPAKSEPKPTSSSSDSAKPDTKSGSNP